VVNRIVAGTKPAKPRPARVTLTNEATDRLLLVGFIIFVVLLSLGAFDDAMQPELAQARAVEVGHG